MAQPLRTRRANLDLAEIWATVAERNESAADRLLQTIERKLELLATFPEMGALCEEFASGLRHSTAGKYVIFYRPLSGGIEVVRVVHGSRDLPSLFP